MNSRRQPQSRLLPNPSNRRGSRARGHSSSGMESLRNRVFSRSRAASSRARNLRFPMGMDLDMVWFSLIFPVLVLFFLFPCLPTFCEMNCNEEMQKGYERQFVLEYTKMCLKTIATLQSLDVMAFCHSRFFLKQEIHTLVFSAIDFICLSEG